MPCCLRAAGALDPWADTLRRRGAAAPAGPGAGRVVWISAAHAVVSELVQHVVAYTDRAATRWTCWPTGAASPSGAAGRDRPEPAPGLVAGRCWRRKRRLAMAESGIPTGRPAGGERPAGRRGLQPHRGAGPGQRRGRGARGDPERDLPDPAGRGAAGLGEAVSRPPLLFHGGPVSPNGAICLASVVTADEEPPDGAGCSTGSGCCTWTPRSRSSPRAYRDLRIFAGYSGWASGPAAGRDRRGDVARRRRRLRRRVRRRAARPVAAGAPAAKRARSPCSRPGLEDLSRPRGSAADGLGLAIALAGGSTRRNSDAAATGGGVLGPCGSPAHVRPAACAQGGGERRDPPCRHAGGRTRIGLASVTSTEGDRRDTGDGDGQERGAYAAGCWWSTTTPLWPRCSRSCCATRGSSRSGAPTATRRWRRSRTPSPIWCCST